MDVKFCLAASQGMLITFFFVWKIKSFVDFSLAQSYIYAKICIPWEAGGGGGGGGAHGPSDPPWHSPPASHADTFS